MKTHPKLDENGQPKTINKPDIPTGEETWTDPCAMALFVPGGKAPRSLNGIPLVRWADTPTSRPEWISVDGTMPGLAEAELVVGQGKRPAAGCVVEEPDGRVWVVKPTNRWAGYICTFPKGHASNWLSLQATAIKECYEEAGLKVQITGFLADIERGLTTTRYYRATRVGGTPTDCGWETQAVALVPKAKLVEQLNSPLDHPLAWALGAPCAVPGRTG